MPELPEVETTRRKLLPYLVNQQIVALDVRRRDLRWPISDNFERLMLCSMVKTLHRLGKYIIADLDNGWSVIIHLGMSGSFRIEYDLSDKLRKHDHILLKTNSNIWAIYHDPRRFGAILTCRTDNLLQHKLLAAIGVDPLDNEHFTAQYLANRLKRRTIAIKQAILCQNIVAGMGNIYASESLFAAGIDPHRPANMLSCIEINRLVASIKKVLLAAIDAGGSTLRDYISGNSEIGYFQHNFQVYGRAGQDCNRCHQTIKKIVIADRSTYFCPNCQT